MRILIISDIHSNIVALEAVFAAVDSYDALWCLGDTIGYGPAPNECIEGVKHAAIAISGNHDLACIGRVDLEDFNPDARKANLWNGEQLLSENRAWLERLTPMYRIDDTFTVAHGSPREPVWEYLLTAEQAMDNFSLFDTQVCLIGHSHAQLAFRKKQNSFCEGFRTSDGEVLKLEPDTRYFINPGSVGQPRDYDPRAAYALLDTETGTFSFRRIGYDIARTQQQMQRVSLPTALIRRLDFGI
jgi:predicted phosphodiesterase